MRKPFGQIIVHPVLFAAFPVLSLFAHNFWEALHGGILYEAVELIVVAVSCTGIVWLVSGWLMRSWIKAAISSSGFVLLFFSYGHFFRAVNSLNSLDPGFTINAEHVSLALWAGGFIAVAWFSFRRTRRGYRTLTGLLNIISVVLVSMPLMTIGYQASRMETGVVRSGGNMKDIDELKSASEPGQHRDIYYLIFDRYTNKQVLKDFYGFDNSEFLNNLSDIGFYVANGSTSNYLKTAHSLVSSLNMEYINWLEGVMGKDSRDWTPLYGEMLLDSRLMRFLKAKGYKIVHFGSWWEPTSVNKYADYNFAYETSSRFRELLIADTIIAPVREWIDPENNEFYHHWKRVRWKFDKLEGIPQWDEPTFTFMHMLVPHFPHVFDENGEFIEQKKIVWKNADEVGLTEGYLDQIRYLNRRLERLLRKLIRESDPAPIIVLQSDEGPFPIEFRNDEVSFDWTKATDDQLRKKMGILNAYYLPDIAMDDVLYQSITPVNSFRILLNSYFDTDMEMLPDRNYIFRGFYHLYEFYDVTDKIRTSGEGKQNVGADVGRDVPAPGMNALALNQLGEEVGKSGNMDAAIAAFEKAYDLDPNDADICNNLGFVYARKGETALAKTYFKKALGIDPTHRKARINLEIIADMIGKEQENSGGR